MDKLARTVDRPGRASPEEAKSGRRPLLRTDRSLTEGILSGPAHKMTRVQASRSFTGSGPDTAFAKGEERVGAGWQKK